MLRINIVLVFCIVGLCAAATTPKPKEANKMKKDVKEKRDAALTSGPYSYNVPQKSYQEQVHQQQQQQKVAPVEYHQKATQVDYYQGPQKQVQVEYQLQAAPQKVASLDYFHQKQQAPIQVQPQQHFQHEGIQYSYPSALEGFNSQPAKGLGDYSFSYPGFESFHQMPIEHYNTELDQINQALVSLQGYKSGPSYYKSPFPQESYSFGSSGQSYDFPQSYHPQSQQQSYVSHSAPSGPAVQQHFGFVQSPAALYIPQTVSINPKPTKIPDYATGSKGLGHYSTVSAIPISAPAPTQSYRQQSYEAPSYKPQSYEISSYMPQSYVAQSYKPQSYEAPVSHLYNQYQQTERPFKASAYLGASHVDSHSEQSISSHKPSAGYLPPNKTYLPAKEPVKNYLPAREPTKTYLPAKEQYVPAREHYAPQQSPVEYQIQYVQVPQKSYLPPSSNSYAPSKSVQESPKSSYLPPSQVTSPQKQYLPPSQPSNNYLPPNNPYHQNSYHSSNSQPQHYQHFESESSHETQEYQSGSASGHK